MLQNHIMTLKEENLKLANQVDEVEQCTNLRFFEIITVHNSRQPTLSSSADDTNYN